MVNFSVKVFYSFIESEGGETFPIQVVWNLWLCEGGFFGWEAVWKALALDQLKRRDLELNGRQCHI